MEESTVLVHNARIYISGEPDYSWMTFNKQSGYIINIGRLEAPVQSLPPENIIDVRSRRILPGLHESHIHLTNYGSIPSTLDLTGCPSIEELQNTLSVYIAENPDKKIIIGRNWEHDKLGRYPDKDDLDKVCSDKPVILIRICYHTMVVNSAALKECGIDTKTKLSRGSHLDTYHVGHKKQGQLTGILREARYLVEKLLTPTEDQQIEWLRFALKHCLAYGVTSAHSLEEGSWNAFCKIADRDELPLRIFFAAYYTYKNSGNFPRPGESRGPMLSCDRIKLFSDGALGASTAAISVPYKGTNNKGLLTYPQSELNELVAEATSSGYRLEIHAIGDAAADTVLEALDVAKVAPEKRPILVHCQILREDILPKMKSHGVIASIQPQFVPTDAGWLRGLLPDSLLKYAYVWKTLLKSGIPCCGGSDAPVEAPRPLIGIYDAIFRPSDKQDSADIKTFRPEECLTVTEAIDLYTKGGAYATMQEHILGQLLPGYQADFIILESDKDVCDHPEEFGRATVAQTWVAGCRKM